MVNEHAPYVFNRSINKWAHGIEKGVKYLANPQKSAEKILIPSLLDLNRRYQSNGLLLTDLILSLKKIEAIETNFMTHRVDNPDFVLALYDLDMMCDKVDSLLVRIGVKAYGGRIVEFKETHSKEEVIEHVLTHDVDCLYFMASTPKAILKVSHYLGELEKAGLNGRTRVMLRTDYPKHFTFKMEPDHIISSPVMTLQLLKKLTEATMTDKIDSIDQ